MFSAIIFLEHHNDPIANSIIEKNLSLLKSEYQCGAVCYEADNDSNLAKETKEWEDSVNINNEMKNKAQTQGVPTHAKKEYEAYAARFDSDEAHLNLLKAIRTNNIAYQGIDNNLGDLRNDPNFNRLEHDKEREKIMAKYLIDMRKKYKFFVAIMGFGHGPNVQKLLKEGMPDLKKDDFIFVSLISRNCNDDPRVTSMQLNQSASLFSFSSLFPLGVKFVDLRNVKDQNNIKHIKPFIMTKYNELDKPESAVLYEQVKQALGNKSEESLLLKIQNGEYSVALRNACNKKLFEIIPIILNYKDSLGIDINEQSSNGNTALDWLIESKNVSDQLQKDKVIELMREKGAYTQKELEKKELEKKEPSISNNNIFSSKSEDVITTNTKIIEEKLEHEIEKIINNNEKFKSILGQIKNHDYGLALRNACNQNALELIKIILRFKDSLSIDLNGQSKNGNTALDWLEATKDESEEKKKVIELMKQAGALCKTDLQKKKKI